MSINHLMKIRIHGRRRLTQKQAKNLICSRYKMWSISKTENNFYGKKFETMQLQTIQDPIKVNIHFCMLFCNCISHNLKNVVFNKTHLKFRQHMLQLHVLLYLQIFILYNNLI